MNDLHYQSLSNICRRIKSGELTSFGVVEHTLQRIERLDGDLRAYALVLADQARADAARLDEDRVAGK
ncbi:MAG: Asp-tRNA(Asn)/Glu-tRNA(Gln) amidotransferase GatCAB subunit A, partial [Proteobacteria bacterium]|nr:Asp-tRNA(Asn)/Glu-tRNA(Gln) amidotransferase GatCAB subunit A [Pseudomonadota bacterium]